MKLNAHLYQALRIKKRVEPSIPPPPQCLHGINRCNFISNSDYTTLNNQTANWEDYRWWSWTALWQQKGIYFEHSYMQQVQWKENLSSYMNCWYIT